LWFDHIAKCGRSDVDSRDQEIAKLRARVDELEAQNSDLSAENREEAASIKILQDALERAESGVYCESTAKAWREDLTRKREECQRLEKLLAYEQDRRTAMRADVALQEAEIRRLRRELRGKR
jgi:predicted RNase H-like nuclease (RuvC/YqgF family)